MATGLTVSYSPAGEFEIAFVASGIAGLFKVAGICPACVIVLTPSPKIIKNAIIALILYFAMYSILQFLIPGGLFA